MILFFLLIPFFAFGLEASSHYLKAKVYEKEKNFQAAIIEYKKALKLDPDSITIKKGLAYCYLLNNDEKLALNLLLEIAKIQEDLEVWNTIGDIYLKNKRYKTAIEAYNNALRIKEDINILYKLADVYISKKQIDNAILTYKRLITHFGKEESALLNLAFLYEKKENLEEAISFYKRVLEINKKNLFALKGLISIYIEEDPNLAEELARRLREIEESPQSFLFLGLALEKNNKYKEAEEYYRRLVELGYEEGYIRFGWLMLKEDRNDEGLELVKNGLSLFSPSFSLSLLYALFLNQKKEYQKAIEIFKTLLKEREDDYLYFHLAVAYDGILNKDFAIKYLYKAIRLNPKNSAAYNYIGYSWVESSKNLKRAFLLIKKALEIEPNNPAYIDSLGWYYYKMKDYEKALSFLLKAYSLKNDDPVILEHIGDVYNDKGMKDEAYRFFKLSLDRFKEEEDKQRIRKKIGRF